MLVQPSQAKKDPLRLRLKKYKENLQVTHIPRLKFPVGRDEGQIISADKWRRFPAKIENIYDPVILVKPTSTPEGEKGHWYSGKPAMN